MRFFALFSSFLILLPTLLGIILFKKLQQHFQVLTIYLLIFSLVETISYILASKGIYTLFLMHVFLPLELALLSWVFKVYMENKIFHRFILFGIIGFTVLSILNTVFLQPLDTFASNTRYLESMLIILLSLTYFYQIFTELKVEKLWEEGMFWFSTGLLIYYAGTMILYLSSNYLMKSVDMKLFAFFFHLVQSICHFLMYSLFTLAIWKGQKK